ncbi:MAG: LON peptidase substrate-binding domain-containing protein [Alphaproteobacteria bacterium]|nr:LON peptidase substrate-binding domain-containing protein [Alphaproteobacteria bacterium]
MAAGHPGAAALPQEFAVFPLAGALLLPRARLPLNIFEPRYLAMTEDALGAGRLFGMIQPDPGHTEGERGPALYRIGCLGRICSFSETGDGRYLITLAGLARFAVAEELAMRRGYRRVRGDFTAHLDDLDPAPQPIGIAREELIAAVKRYFARRGYQANWDQIERMPDEMLVITLAMVCPFEPVEKQALLEAATTPARAETLLALLEMGAAGSDPERVTRVS